MPKYFFHVIDGTGRRDTDGSEKESIEAARRTAVVFAGDLMRDCAASSSMNNEWRIEVTNEHGLMLFQIDVHLTDTPVLRGDPLTKRQSVLLVA